MKIRAVGDRILPCGRTDRHEEANSRFFFRNFANAPENRTKLNMETSISPPYSNNAELLTAALQLSDQAG